jgi:hypothetical protein
MFMSPALVCPQGHPSDDIDFCSVCGTKLVDSSTPAPATNCPDCGVPREPAAGAFCEACGHNYDTGAPGQLVWTAEVSIDPALREDGSPEPPAGTAAQQIELTRDSSLIGRRSDRRAIFPEIALDADDAISHRHALLNRLPDGSLVLRDIESSNGTRLNGVDLKPLVDTRLKDGDQITLGHWTRITIKSGEMRRSAASPAA